MSKLNENQVKHISNSLRVIAMAQFATYGYNALQTNNFKLAFISMCVYVGIELVNVSLLKEKE